ncbi:unannotated protein [freshwater metagenome]|uniref:Unannotated protein n=1 Tax=freshwater metagenome TaxID=449393 RepID=A0A6J7MA08_9ZZZZ|nr:nuclear transport factor 2 family protein [Actinomycetota bacterium]
MPLDLQTISDRMEIDDLLVRYSRAIDTKNFAELENLFIPDGEYDAGSLGHPTNAKAIRAMIESAIGGLDATMHLVAKSLIDLDGDTAEVRTYLVSQHIRESTPGPVKHYFIGAEYADRVVRTAEGWKFAYRRLDRMWKEGDRSVIVRD